MFGQLRFLLAYLVVVSHLVGSNYLAHFGFYAVVGFFVIAGFVMTSALNEVYHFDGIRFCINRALRLLPPYYIVSAITLVVVAAVPDQAGEYLKFWHADMQLRDVLLNFAVLPMQTTDPTFRMVPPFWSIAIEVQMYVMLYLMIARRLGWALVALTVGLCYHLACTYANLGWAVHYFPVPSAVLPFAAGALVYFMRQRELWSVAPSVAFVAFAVWCANMLAGGWIFPDSYVFGIGYYVGIVLFTVVVAGLAGLQLAPMLCTDRSDAWRMGVFRLFGTVASRLCRRRDVHAGTMARLDAARGRDTCDHPGRSWLGDVEPFFGRALPRSCARFVRSSRAPNHGRRSVMRSQIGDNRHAMNYNRIAGSNSWLFT